MKDLMGTTTTVARNGRESSRTEHRPAELFGLRVLGVVGHGARSTVYRATEPGTGRVVALKHVVRTGARDDDRFFEQLRNEHAAGLATRGCAHVRQVERLEVRRHLLTRAVLEAALVLEFCDGRPVDPADYGGARVAEALADFAGAARALAALHRAAFVHCDFKPSNVLRCGGGAGGEGGVRLIDLGQACPSGTRKERIQGTPEYIAPEQVRREPVSPATDAFALGAALYACLTGRPVPTLYTAGRRENSFVMTDRIPRPHELEPAVPPAASDLVMQCLRPDPARRPADLAEVARRLETMEYGLRRRAAAVPPTAAVPAGTRPSTVGRRETSTATNHTRGLNLEALRARVAR